MSHVGKRRHRLRIEELVQEEDPDYGGTVGNPTWAPVATVWARRKNTLRATAEAVAGGTTVAPIQVEWEMRPRAITAAMRMVGVGGDHDGVIYDVKSFGIDNAGREMSVIATSGANNG